MMLRVRGVTSMRAIGDGSKGGVGPLLLDGE
jgi:hypothetical protein